MKWNPLLCALLGWSASARADSWAPPKTVDYYSADSSFFVRVVPTFVPASYYAWRSATAKKK